MRVLIIKTAPLAGILAALPVLDYLHQAVPGVEIDWIVDEEFREVLEGNPLVSTLLTVPSDSWRKLPHALANVREVGALKETLIERGYKYAFDLEGTLISGLISRFSGAQDRIGFERNEVQRSNLLFSMRRIPLRRQDSHVTQKCLRLVSVPFAKDYREMELGSTISTAAPDDHAAEALLATLSDGLVFMFDCSGECPTRLWTGEAWIELGRRVADTYPDSMILLPWEGDEERELVTAVARSVPGARLLEHYTLKGMAALLKRVDAVVGGDTDRVMMAAALGTPTVSFYRATDGKVSGPRGEHHVVVQSPIHCTRCMRTHCDKDVQCRSTIKVEALLAGIQSLFSA